MHIEIRNLVNGEDSVAGILRLEGGTIVAEPADSTLLRGILASPVYDREAQRGVSAESDPEAFLRALYQQYRSAYLRASAPLEDAPRPTRADDYLGDGETVRKSWDESAHPRGHEGNPGQFAAKGESGVATTATESSESVAADSSTDSPKKAKFGKSKAEVYYGGKGKKYQEEIDRRFRGLLGTDDAETIASLVGAPDDAKVTIDSSHSRKLIIEVEHAAFKAKRYVLRGEDGRPYLENAEFWVKEGKQGAGLGAEVFGRQVENAIEAGISFIKCHAAKENPREPSKPHNGYYTWPRFGYDAAIERDNFDDEVYDQLAKEFPTAESLLDVMATPAGREWWKKNGSDIYAAKFDLSEGSRSRQVFDAYLEERSRRSMKEKSYMGIDKNANRPQRGIEEIVLSAKDERWLDAAWAKLDARQEQEGRETSENEEK